MASHKIAIVGASGAVGQELLHILGSRGYCIEQIRCFASPRSLGQSVRVGHATIPLQMLHEGCFADITLAFFCAGKEISLHYARQAQAAGVLVIDLSSAFRQDPSVPLVIPEINAHALARHEGLIASPNCSTTIMLMVLAPLHRHCRIKRIVVATYQAVSGAGARQMQVLLQQTQEALGGKPRGAPPNYAFNLFLHGPPLPECGYGEEELKMLSESRKILEDDALRVTATCVRVPILRAHSEALNVEFHAPLSAKTAYEILQNAPGVQRLEDPSAAHFPMPIDASGQDNVLFGRVREDLSHANALDMWVVGDQLLKGAALNAVQIAEHLFAHALKA